jgi:hypothetical protein
MQISEYIIINKHNDSILIKNIIENYIPFTEITEEDKDNFLSQYKDEKGKQLCDKIMKKNESLVRGMSQNYKQMLELVKYIDEVFSV